MSIKRPLAIRFVEKVSPEPNSGCWLWCGGTGNGRYGCIRDGKNVIAVHRAAWMLTHGDIPEGMHVCHRCDVTWCVNPDHLFLSDHDGNMEDKGRKGRSIKKLSPDQVRAIRAMAKTGMLHKDIAARFGVTRSTVSPIVSGVQRRFVQ